MICAWWELHPPVGNPRQLYQGTRRPVLGRVFVTCQRVVCALPHPSHPIITGVTITIAIGIVGQMNTQQQQQQQQQQQEEEEEQEQQEQQLS